MQQNKLKAIAMRVLERSQRNTPCNNDATTPENTCNRVAEIRAEKLRVVACQIIEVACEIGVKPEIGLGFFSALDWGQFVDDRLGLDEIRKCVEYAQHLHEQTRAGTRLIEVREMAIGRSLESRT